jgi:hypothetical protein
MLTSLWYGSVGPTQDKSLKLELIFKSKSQASFLASSVPYMVPLHMI